MKKLISLFCCMAIAFLAGCNNSNNDAIGNNNEQNELIQVKNSTSNHIDRKTGQDIAKHLVEIAKGIPDVKDATAVVLGKYAVVGIDVDSKIDRSRVSTIKYSVAESLKKDPNGANAVVVADADTIVRLKEMGKEIQNGKPVSGILEELANIVGRIMPELPSDIIENNNADPLDENKKQLNHKEDKNLQKEQKDQSNIQ